MNEKHMGEIERQLLQVSRSRKRLRDAATELKQDGAEEHLVAALLAADGEIEKVYKKLFQSTYFHVPENLRALEADPEVRKSDPVQTGQQRISAVDDASSAVPPPEHKQESLLP